MPEGQVTGLGFDDPLVEPAFVGFLLKDPRFPVERKVLRLVVGDGVAVLQVVPFVRRPSAGVPGSLGVLVGAVKLGVGSGVRRPNVA